MKNVHPSPISDRCEGRERRRTPDYDADATRAVDDVDGVRVRLRSRDLQRCERSSASTHDARRVCGMVAIERRRRVRRVVLCLPVPCRWCWLAWRRHQAGISGDGRRHLSLSFGRPPGAVSWPCRCRRAGAAWPRRRGGHGRRERPTWRQSGRVTRGVRGSGCRSPVDHDQGCDRRRSVIAITDGARYRRRQSPQIASRSAGGDTAKGITK